MAGRTTVDIPEPLHDELRRRAHQSGTSVRALIIRAIKQAYNNRKNGDYVAAPLIKGGGKLGPRFPKDENPHDLVFS